MSDWTSRIKECMKTLGMTQEELAAKMGLTRGAITHYLAGRRVPPLNQFEKLAAVLKVDPSWLQFGYAVAPAKKSLIKESKEIKKQHLIPILSWDQALKADQLKQKDIHEWVPHFYCDNANWFALKVKGDSMIAPAGYGKSFQEGDLIIIDPKINPKNGNFVIALLPKSKEAIFKQYVLDGDKIYLKPLNPQYPIIEINKRTHILGVISNNIISF